MATVPSGVFKIKSSGDKLLIFPDSKDREPFSKNSSKSYSFSTGLKRNFSSLSRLFEPSAKTELSLKIRVTELLFFVT